ncbi:MAG: RDD family protein [Actinomycetota bacterium]
MMYDMQRDPTAVMGRRILAFAIDAIAVGLLVAVFMSPNIETEPAPETFLGEPCEVIEARDPDLFCIESGDEVITVDTGSFASSIGVQLLLSFGNAVVLQSLVGTSIGKMVTGLRVVRPDGQIAGFGAMFVRWLCLWTVDGFCFLVGLITALVSRGHRRVGDMLAGTYVVRVDDMAMLGGGTSPPPPSGTWVPPADAWNPSGGAPPPVPPSPAPGPGSPPPWTPET